MTELKLSKGKVAIIDDEDFEKVSQWRWCAFWNGWKWYVKRTYKKNSVIYLHRFITDAPKGVEVDHKNGDGLDNRKENLRVCTRTENSRNRAQQKNNTSGYKGVSWNKERRKWDAKIKVGKKHVFIGRFKTKEEAARAYDQVAMINFKDY